MSTAARMPNARADTRCTGPLKRPDCLEVTRALRYHGLAESRPAAGAPAD
jgi:hypothetical protein